MESEDFERVAKVVGKLRGVQEAWAGWQVNKGDYLRVCGVSECDPRTAINLWLEFNRVPFKVGAVYESRYSRPTDGPIEFDLTAELAASGKNV